MIVKSYIKDSRVYNAASIGTDHSLLMTKLNISIKQNRKLYPRRTPKKYYVEKLITDPIAANDFQIKKRGKFEPL